MSEDLSGVHVWLVLWKAAHAVEQNARRSIAALGLGMSDFAVLEVLLHTGPQPVNTIGRKVMLTSGSITTAVDRLEARGFVKRTMSVEDKRARVVELTPEGKALITQAFRQHARDMEQTMRELSPAERRQLLGLLKRVGLSAADRLT